MAFKDSKGSENVVEILAADFARVGFTKFDEADMAKQNIPFSSFYSVSLNGASGASVLGRS